MIPKTAIIVLTGVADQEMGINAVGQGAQDYLVKGDLNRGGLWRSVVYALERKKGAKILDAQKQDYLIIFDSFPGMIFYLDAQNIVVRANRGAAQILEMPVQTLIGRNFHDLFPEGAAVLGSIDAARIIADGQPRLGVLETFLTPRGIKRWAHLDIVPYRGLLGEMKGAILIVQDITEKLQAQEALSQSYQELAETARGLTQSRNMLQLVIESIPIRVFWKDEHLRYLGCNTLFAHDAGLSDPEQLLGRDDFVMGWREQAERYRADDLQVMESRQPKMNIVEPQTTPAGDHIWLNTSKVPLENPDGKVIGVLGIYEDITARKHAEENLRRLTRSLLTLSQCNEALVRAVVESDLLREICRIIVDTGGYRLAWVGLADHDAAKTLRPVAWAGSEGGFLENCRFSWEADAAGGQNPGGVAITTGHTCVVRELSEAGYDPAWQTAARQMGFASAIGLPLRVDDRIIGALIIDSQESNAFDADEVKLLEELASDISFGIKALQASAARRQAEEQLRESLEKVRQTMVEIVQAMALIAEIRDPYTGGHQRRVTHLAVAIAQAMGLDQNRIDGLRVAGFLHDIGKITVPAEILSKPGKLSTSEFNIVKMHANIGHEILSRVSFPWPVAQIVLQHHERLDGSGYPQGLRGPDIILEARILAVADVVEAMASHRPYRPALGLEEALAEVNRHQGVLYDAPAVAACTEICRAENFSWDQEPEV